MLKKNLKKKSKIKYILKFPSPKRSKEPFLSNIVSIVGTIFTRGVQHSLRSRLYTSHW
jgi:hypothetical protein